VEWASFCGPSVEFKPDYLAYYAALDPYRPVCDAAPTGSLVRLSQSVPAADLRKDEWYNDFVIKCGVREIVGARLACDFSRTAILGVHYGIHQPPSAWGQTVELQKLLEISAGSRPRLFEPSTSWPRVFSSRRVIGVWSS
jgi:hypothetical protein